MRAKYKLLKDLPDSKAGDIYEWNKASFLVEGAYFKNGDIAESYWMRESVEGNTEWFYKIEEHPVLTGHEYFNELHEMLAKASETISTIIKIKKQRNERLNRELQLYTEEDMRKCFEAARAFNPHNLTKSGTWEWVHLIFDDYLKSIKQRLKQRL